MQTVCAADLFPTPEFSNHPIPQAQTPAPRPSWHEYLDLAFLAAALAAASLLAVKGRSRTGLFLLSIVSLAWLGFWRKGCVCPIGAIQNVTQAVFDKDYAAGGLVIAVFVLPLVFTLFFGRSFCASVCPLGAVQELVAVRPVQVPTWIDHALGLLAYVYLGAAVLFAATGSAWIICRYDPFVGLFRLTSSASMLALSAGFLGVGLFIGRPYCRWLCPYGAILALLSRVSWRHLRIPPQQCVQCRLCEDACPYGAIQRPTVAPVARRANGGPAAVDRRALRGADPDRQRGASWALRCDRRWPACIRPSSLPSRSGWNSPARRRRGPMPRRPFARPANPWSRFTEGRTRSCRNSPGAGPSSAAGWGWSSPSNWCSFPFAAAAPITNPTAAPAYPADVASGIAPRSTRGRSSIQIQQRAER